MFIHKLGLTVTAQQHTEIIKPGYNALKFDTINQENRYRYFCLAYVVQERILKVLSGELTPEEGEFAVEGTVLSMTQDVGMSRPDDTLRDDVPRYVKIGSVDQIADIVQAALPGVGVKIDTTPPAAIPLRAHMIYMRLDKHGRYWDALKGSGSVAIYQPVKPDRVKLELIVVDP